MIFLSGIKRGSKALWSESVYMQILELCLALQQKGSVPEQIKYQETLSPEFLKYFSDHLANLSKCKIKVSPMSKNETLQESTLYLMDDETCKKYLSSQELQRTGRRRVNMWSLKNKKVQRVLPVSSVEAKKFQRRQEVHLDVPELPTGIAGREDDELLCRYAQKSATDAMTMLPNRARFEELTSEFSKLNPDARGSLILIDIDNMHDLNSKYGYVNVNKIIQKMAEVMKKCTRKSDILGRYGGDEFLVYATGASPNQAKIVAQRIQREVGKEITELGQRMPFSISMGISRSVTDLPLAFAEAEDALKNAKQSGNPIVMYELGMETPAQRRKTRRRGSLKKRLARSVIPSKRKSKTSLLDK